MSKVKVSELLNISSLDLNDLLYIVDVSNLSGNISNKIRIADFIEFLDLGSRIRAQITQFLSSINKQLQDYVNETITQSISDAISELHEIAKSGLDFNYPDISEEPTDIVVTNVSMPNQSGNVIIVNKGRVSNKAIIITKNNVEIGRFTLNQSTEDTINIDVPDASEFIKIVDIDNYVKDGKLSFKYKDKDSLDKEFGEFTANQSSDSKVSLDALIRDIIEFAKSEIDPPNIGNGIFNITYRKFNRTTGNWEDQVIEFTANQSSNTGLVVDLSSDLPQGSVVNDSLITLKSGNNILGSFRLNQNSDEEINIEGFSQSDWNETDSTQPSYIKNKPNLSKVAETGSYNDLTDKPYFLVTDTNIVGKSLVAFVDGNNTEDNVSNQISKLICYMTGYDEEGREITNLEDYLYNRGSYKGSGVAGVPVSTLSDACKVLQSFKLYTKANLTIKVSHDLSYLYNRLLLTLEDDQHTQYVGNWDDNLSRGVISIDNVEYYYGRYDNGDIIIIDTINNIKYTGSNNSVSIGSVDYTYNFNIFKNSDDLYHPDCIGNNKLYIIGCDDEWNELIKGNYISIKLPINIESSNAYKVIGCRSNIEFRNINFIGSSLGLFNYVDDGNTKSITKLYKVPSEIKYIGSNNIVIINGDRFNYVHHNDDSLDLLKYGSKYDGSSGSIGIDKLYYYSYDSIDGILTLTNSTDPSEIYTSSNIISINNIEFNYSYNYESDVLTLTNSTDPTDNYSGTDGIININDLEFYYNFNENNVLTLTNSTDPSEIYTGINTISINNILFNYIYDLDNNTLNLIDSTSPSITYSGAEGSINIYILYNYSYDNSILTLTNSTDPSEIYTGSDGDINIDSILYRYIYESIDSTLTLFRIKLKYSGSNSVIDIEGNNFTYDFPQSNSIILSRDTTVPSYSTSGFYFLDIPYMISTDPNTNDTIISLISNPDIYSIVSSINNILIKDNLIALSVDDEEELEIKNCKFSDIYNAIYNNRGELSIEDDIVVNGVYNIFIANTSNIVFNRNINLILINYVSSIFVTKLSDIMLSQSNNEVKLDVLDLLSLHSIVDSNLNKVILYFTSYVSDPNNTIVDKLTGELPYAHSGKLNYTTSQEIVGLYRYVGNELTKSIYLSDYTYTDVVKVLTNLDNSN